LEGLEKENRGICMTIWSNLRPLKILYGNLEYFVVIWYIFPRFGMLYQEKSGNPHTTRMTQLKGLQVWSYDTLRP
jgi:hypothetical protein